MVLTEIGAYWEWYWLRIGLTGDGTDWGWYWLGMVLTENGTDWKWFWQRMVRLPTWRQSGRSENCRRVHTLKYHHFEAALCSLYITHNNIRLVHIVHYVKWENGNLTQLFKAHDDHEECEKNQFQINKRILSKTFFPRVITTDKINRHNLEENSHSNISTAQLDQL